MTPYARLVYHLHLTAGMLFHDRPKTSNGLREAAQPISSERLVVYLSTLVAVTTLLAAAPITPGLPYISDFFMWVLLPVPGLCLVAATWLALRHLSGQLAAESEQVNHLVNRLAEREQELTEVTTIDSLTGCLKSAAWNESLEVHVALGRRMNYDFTIALIRLDQLDAILEKHGIEPRHEVLKLFGRILKTSLREVDVAGRLSDDTFALVLAGVTESEAIAVIQRVNGYLAQLYLPEDKHLRLTSSVGLSVFTGSESGDELENNAACALQRAVDEGGDCVAVYAAPDVPRTDVRGADLPAAQPIAASAH